MHRLESPGREPCRVLVLLLEHVHLQDLAGPAQVFHEAASFGAPYQVLFCGVEDAVRSSQGLVLSRLVRLPRPQARDLVIVPGVDTRHLDAFPREALAWLDEAHAAGARIAAVCTGAFVLARAGLLAGRDCTTHWKVIDRLRREHPEASVLEHRLYVCDGRVSTSAGVTAGIDLALSLVHGDHGAELVGHICREMVVYLRRWGTDGQRSIFVEYRSHLHTAIHRVQDWIIQHPDETPTLEALSRIAAMSPRHLSRTFRAATGVTLKHYVHEVKLELAARLLRIPGLSMDEVARRCGFEDPRQLRRLWSRTHGVSPAAWRRAQGAREAA